MVLGFGGWGFRVEGLGFHVSLGAGEAPKSQAQKPKRSTYIYIPVYMCIYISMFRCVHLDICFTLSLIGYGFSETRGRC